MTWLGLDFDVHQRVPKHPKHRAFIGQLRNSWWEPGENTPGISELEELETMETKNQVTETSGANFEHQPGLQSQNEIHPQTRSSMAVNSKVLQAYTVCPSY